MHSEQRPSGLVVVTDQKPEPPKPPRDEYDGSTPLHARDTAEWISRLAPDQKDELLGYFPTMFLRCGGGGIFGGNAMTDLVCKLRARTTHLSGVHFEEFT